MSTKLFLCCALLLFTIVEVARSDSEYFGLCMMDCLDKNCKKPPSLGCHTKCEFNCINFTGGNWGGNFPSVPLKNNAAAGMYDFIYF